MNKPTELVNQRGSEGFVPWPDYNDPDGKPWMASRHQAARLEELRRANGTLWMKLLELCGRRDPMNLTSIGAPPDEYEPEVRVVMEGIGEIGSVDDLARTLGESFDRMFSGHTWSIPDSSYTAIAQDFWPYLEADRKEHTEPDSEE